MLHSTVKTTGKIYSPSESTTPHAQEIQESKNSEIKRTDVAIL